MNLSNTFKGLLVAAAVSLAATTPASASPAGDEYIPQVPSGHGNTPVDQGPGGISKIEDAVAGMNGAVAPGKGGAAKNGGGEALPLETSSGGDDSSGVLDTIFDPVVLLLIAGVLAIAVGMILARRQGEGASDPTRARRNRPAAPPTPDGEIVAGGGDSPAG